MEIVKPFKELGLDSQRVKKLASKLHVHSVNFAAKLVHTRRALSSTVINSHQEPVSGKACNPPDPHWFLLSFFAVEELYGAWYQSGSFSLINVGSGFHSLRSVVFLSFFWYVAFLVYFLAVYAIVETDYSSGCDSVCDCWFFKGLFQTELPADSTGFTTSTLHVWFFLWSFWLRVRQVSRCVKT